MSEKIFKDFDIKTLYPREVRALFQIFNHVASDSIRLVGGCVRDMLIGKKVNDFDLATKFLPEKTIEILQEYRIKAVPTGIKYGTVTAAFAGRSFEITTLRKDEENDGRHPKAEFVDDYFLDAKRRDFTINALYADENGDVFDYFDGISDLEMKKVRFIGDADERIKEDYLRILRFFRFSNFYADKIDEDGVLACKKNQEGIKRLSSERIKAEFFKFINSSQGNILQNLDIFEKSGIAKHIFSNRFNLIYFKRLLEVENILQEKLDALLRFFVLIAPFRQMLEGGNFDEINNFKHDLAKINLSNQEKRYINRMFSAFIELEKEFDENYIKKMILFQGRDITKDVLIANSAIFDLGYKVFDQVKFVENFHAPNFVLNGNDLLKAGFSGEEIGLILYKAKEFWIENNFEISAQELIEMAKNDQF